MIQETVRLSDADQIEVDSLSVVQVIEPPTCASLRAFFDQCTRSAVPFRLSAYETVVDLKLMIDTLLARMALDGSYGTSCRDHLLRLKSYIDTHSLSKI